MRSDLHTTLDKFSSRRLYVFQATIVSSRILSSIMLGVIAYQ